MSLSIMAKEAREFPSVIAQQLDKNDEAISQLAGRLQQLNPNLIYIIGDVSSFTKATVNAPPFLADSVCFSMSGLRPD